jgi:glycosyltransferase involved in cell wall biosynthesis
MGVAVVHCHGVGAGLAVARAAFAGQPAPVLVYTAHELSGFESGAFGLSRLGRAAYRRMLGRMHGVIVLSQRDRQALGALAPAVVGDVEVIPPGVDTRRVRQLIDPGHKKSRLGLSLNSAIVGIVADLDQHGGAETFLRAAALVNEELPNIEFVIVGDGPLRAQYQRLAHSLKLTGAATFLGRRHDLPEVLATLNVAVVSSEAGGGVQTALQALSLEIPVVAVKTGGLVEVLDGLEEVALVPPGDVPLMAAALRVALERVPARSGGRVAISSATGLSLTEKDMLVSTESFDLDRPGLSAHDRAPAGTAGLALARRYGVGTMVRRTVLLYRRLLQASEPHRATPG